MRRGIRYSVLVFRDGFRPEYVSEVVYDKTGGYMRTSPEVGEAIKFRKKGFADIVAAYAPRAYLGARAKTIEMRKEE